MFPLFVGVGSALLFGLFAYGTYGLAVVTEHAWVGMVFSVLLGSGLLVFGINRKTPCWICRRKKPVLIFERLCRTAASCS